MKSKFDSIKTVKFNNKEFRVRELLGYFIVDCFELWRNETTKLETEGWVYKFHSNNESEVYEQIEWISNQKLS